MAVSAALRYPKSLWSYNPIPNGCVLYLPLWHPNLRGAKFKSIAPSGTEVTVNGASRVADGLSFDGTDDNVILDASILTFSTQASYSLWVKYDTTDTGYLFSMDGNEISLFHQASASIQVYYDGVARVTGNSPTWSNTWVNLLFTVLVSGTAYLYADGVEFDNGAMPGTGVTSAAARLGEGTAGTNDWTGTIGEFTSWNRVLTAAEALYYYNRTKWRFV
ncbi:hypothetical protein LCGC14_2951810 [marine sediment metagenome]|uniref:LamG-like jellyroll fold domain-containing protein n=1 Tax=marine sediment metagenome TaxID=412755 RepID=A0A0F8XFK9_9ZZZZ